MGNEMNKAKNAIRLALIVCEWNRKITRRMENAAKAEAEKAGCKIAIYHVPGCYDVPFAASELILRNDIDAIAVLGAVIKGETKHDEAIYNATAITLQKLAIKHGKPIGLGIIGPGATEKLASERAEEYARRAVQAAISLYRYRKNAPNP